MDTLHVDHLGPFVQSKSKNSYLIIAVDSFTKFVFLKAVQSTKVKPLIQFIESIIDTFGLPRRFICDRGTCYISNIFVEYCAKFSIKLVHIATSTPRENGQVERYNRIVLSNLKTMVSDEKKWDEVIHKIRWTLNCTINKSTYWQKSF